jgi:pSer/pThr/pTyr-binding forkhead associated (FHA) protein
MSETSSSLSDSEFDALLTDGGTAHATIGDSRLTEDLGRRLQAVTRIVSRLQALPGEPSLVSEGPSGAVSVTPIGSSLTAGRSSKCGLVCREQSGLSKQHFEVIRQEMEYFLRDLDSTNGTTVNGLLCRPGDVRRLLDGDLISAGRKTFVFLAGMPAPPEPVTA